MGRTDIGKYWISDTHKYYFGIDARCVHTIRNSGYMVNAIKEINLFIRFDEECRICYCETWSEFQINDICRDLSQKFPTQIKIK
jgi:hypothetical protein